MARQAGPHYFIGRIGNLIYYKMRGEYFVKELSTPTREQIKKSKNDRSHKYGYFLIQDSR